MVGLDADMGLHVASLPVGLDSRLAELPARLSDGTDGVYFLGIVGMAGAGKTSLAKAIYNKLFLHFHCVSFLPNVGGKSKESVQEQLLLDTTYFRWEPIRILYAGDSIIRRRLETKKVLLVLDDVSDLDQLNFLAGGREWFGRGSRVVVTTRYRDILLQAIDLVDDVYDVKPLSVDESLELLCGHAFGETSPREEFRQVSKQLVSYCKGLPLALEVIGSSLAGMTSKEDWEDRLDQLKEIPDERIQARLTTSFDSLAERLQVLFLDIACFFVGWNKDYVVTVLEACRIFAKSGIKDLINKCLVQVDEWNRLQMHDFFRDMGREIVRRQSPSNPGMRSRLWYCEDALTIFRSDLGTEKIEGIALNAGSAVKASAKAFKEMKLLRVLQLRYLELHGDYGLISKELRLLHWHNFFNKFIPDDFYLEQVVVIDMQYNILKEFFQDNQARLPKLKILNLSHSYTLTKSPNFCNFPNLEKLIMKYCRKLVSIHPSIGNLHRLASMNLRGCIGLVLEELPVTIGTLQSLKHFVFTREERKMPNADSPMTGGGGENQEVSYTLTRHGYYSFLTSEEVISLMRFPKKEHLQIIPVFRLTMLKSLKLIRCGVVETELPADLSSLISLEYLDLRRNEISSLPDTFSQLVKLKYLHLDGCAILEVLPDMPPSLICLSAVECWSLRRMSMKHFNYETRLLLTNCRKLEAIDGLQGRSDRKGSIHLEMCLSLEAQFIEFLLKDWCLHGHSNVFLPGTDIPKWFHYRTSGSSLTIIIPPSWYGYIKELTVCVIFSSYGMERGKFPHPKVDINPLNISYSPATYQKILSREEDHLWVFHLPESFFLGKLNYVNELKLDADFGRGWPVRGLGAFFTGKVLYQKMRG